MNETVRIVAQMDEKKGVVYVGKRIINIGGPVPSLRDNEDLLDIHHLYVHIVFVFYLLL